MPAKKESEKNRTHHRLDRNIKVKEIPLAKIIIPEYQRKRLNLTKLARMVKDWDWRLYDAIVVCSSSENAGYFNVIKGQHRTRGARERGYDTLPSRVLPGKLTIEEQARIFSEEQASQTRMSKADMFRAHVFEKRPYALDIIKILEEFGFAFPEQGSYRTKDVIAAVTVVLRLYASGTPAKKDGTHSSERIRFVLGLVRDAWDHSVSKVTLAGLGSVWTSLLLFSRDKKRRAGKKAHDNPEYLQTAILDKYFDRNRLIRVLRKQSPEAIEEQALTRKRAFTGSQAEWFTYLVIEAYNNHLKASKKLPVKMPGVQGLVGE